MVGQRNCVSTISVVRKLEVSGDGGSRINGPIVLRCAREGYSTCRQQSNDEVLCRSRSDVRDTETDRHVFMSINHAVSRSASFSNQRRAPIAQHRQLPSRYTDLPNAAAVRRYAQKTLHVRDFHVEYGNSRQPCSIRSPACASVARVIN